jgi:hypothetical protein
MSARRILLVACGALAREIRALKVAHGWTHLDVSCLPAILHNRPDRIVDAVLARVRAGQRTHDEVLVLYGDCGTGGLLGARLAELGVEQIGGPHCYAFFAGADDFAAMMEEEPGSFFLTDYLARHFDRLVWRGLGLDRHPQLLKEYFGHYRRVVHLVQQPDPVVAARAEAAAAALRLPLETRATGLTGLAGFLAPLVA